MKLLQSLAKRQYLLNSARGVARLVSALGGHREPRVVEVSLPWWTSIRVNTAERLGRSIWRSRVTLEGHKARVLLGWTTHKPLLTSVKLGPAIDQSRESPNHLETLTPQRDVERFRRWGWSVI